ncbi:hypothetical protein GCM10009551_053610 [Nocardiopsis tropica]|uniref:hypothetical protein n=1 Tax=Tsukamurella strandjordii TaxID=147577 RepID=UPI0031D5F19E
MTESTESTTAGPSEITLVTRAGTKTFSGDEYELAEHVLGFFIVKRAGETVWSEGVDNGVRQVVEVRFKNYKHFPEGFPPKATEQ